MDIKSHVDKIIVSNFKLKSAIRKAAKWINKEYENEPVLLVGILNGCIPFLGQLLTKLKIRCAIDFMRINSFAGTTEAQTEPIIEMDLKTNINNKHILIVEDIIDSAKTLKKIVSLFNSRNAKSVKIITLLDKPSGRKVELNADYSCITIPNGFIIGYGLDYKEEYRNLNCIATLNKKYL